MEAKIRKAKYSDLKECGKILTREFSKQNEPWDQGKAEKRLEQTLFLEKHGRGANFCLEQGGKIIGFVFCEIFPYYFGKTLWVNELVIEENQQGKGFGRKLLRFIEKFAKKNGIKAMMLGANPKERAFKIYKKAGFKESKYIFMEKEL